MKDVKTIKNDPSVVSSQAMMAPGMMEMLRKKTYPKLTTPPTGHARVSGDPGQRTCTLTYMGYDIVEIRVDEAAQYPKLRFHSDGDFQSYPFIQQFVVSAGDDQCTRATFTFRFPCKAYNMRPRRAQGGEAIIGQVGMPLMYGVNGMYVPEWDLLLSVHGKRFVWTTAEMVQEESGVLASFVFELNQSPLVVLVRPRYYAEHLGYKTHRPWLKRPNPKAVAGWCSWEAYHSEVEQEHIAKAAKVLSPLIPYGLEYMQLDDGYQQYPIPPEPGALIADGWLNTNSKFPGGHEAIVSAMKGGGFKPGIWTNSAVTNWEFAENSGHCLMTADGTALKGDWIQYVMDCTEETLKKHVTPYYQKFREYGYEYVKSDALRHLIFDGLQEAVRLGLMDEETAFKRQRAYMEAAREGIGEETYYLSCWGVLTQSIGVCDAMRVGTDANPSWYAISMQMRETARWFFAQRVLFTLDPDHVCVRAEYPWVRMMLSLVSLTGGLYMISDKPETYTPDRIELIRRTLPPLETVAAEVGPVDYTTPACYHMREASDWGQAARDIAHLEKADNIAPFSSLWATHFAADCRTWCVVQRAAVAPLAKGDIELDKLSLDPAKTYYAYDFWRQAGMGCITDGKLHMDALSLGDTQVVALTDVSDGLPHLVGSDRHVSMDLVSVKHFASDSGHIRLELSGFQGLTCCYAIYNAGDARISKCTGGKAKIELQNNLAMLTASFDGEQMVIDL